MIRNQIFSPLMKNENPAINLVNEIIAKRGSFITNLYHSTLASLIIPCLMFEPVLRWICANSISRKQRGPQFRYDIRSFGCSCLKRTVPNTRSQMKLQSITQGQAFLGVGGINGFLQSKALRAYQVAHMLWGGWVWFEDLHGPHLSVKKKFSPLKSS